jgi:hypothetical protein
VPEPLEVPEAAISVPAPSAPIAPPSLPPPATRPAPSPAAESALVLEAAQALRRDHDPKRAIKLLDEYRLRYPQGDLAEESLALSIEARSVRGDGAAASQAREYLRRFPQGRFRVQAVAAEQRFAR